MASANAIAIFAKAPIAGFAKTRLIPRLGPSAAADLQRLMIERTVRTAIDSRIGPVSLWCAPDRNHTLFLSLAADYSVDLYSQSGGDLGERMLSAFEALTVTCPAILIGCDCPALQKTHLDLCASALRCGFDAVFVPTEDGGYALVGAAKPWPELFQDVPWGSSDVMSDTRLRAMRLGLRISEPVTLWDVDTPEDYERAVRLNLLSN